MATSSTNHDPVAVNAATRDSVNGQGKIEYLDHPAQYATVLRFVAYSRHNPKRMATEVPQSEIILPLPINLKEYYSIQYTDVEFDKFGGVLETGEKAVDQYIDSGGYLGGASDTFMKGLEGWTAAMARKTASFFSEDASGLIDRIQGNIVNPHITTLFKGVAPREHELRWKLGPRSATESAKLKQIIERVRSHMHPTKKTAFLLNFPDECYVSFISGGKEFINPMFKSVVAGIVAEYSSEGTNAFHKDDRPQSVELEIMFKEVEALTREDFNGLGDNLGTGSGSVPEGSTGGAGTGNRNGGGNLGSGRF